MVRPCRNAKLYVVSKGTERTRRELHCKIECMLCRGAGKVETCPTCEGAGLYHGQRCNVCNAHGCVPAEPRDGRLHLYAEK
jgi:RecJ-like exonuclease